MGGDINVHINMQCTQWKMSAKEHYIGDFRVKTRNPVLLIGNTWDRATPFVSAQNVSDALEGSVLLRRNGYGASAPRSSYDWLKLTQCPQHASVAQPSLCTGMVVQDYFLHGMLLPKGKVCQPSIPTFSNKDWKNVFPEPWADGGPEAVVLKAMMGLRQRMPHWRHAQSYRALSREYNCLTLIFMKLNTQRGRMSCQ